MADLQRLLGGMLASGMGGRSRRGPAFANSSFSGSRSGLSSFGQTAGLASLGYLAYKAYQEYQKNNPPSGTRAGTTPPRSGTAPARDTGGPSLGERLGDLFGTSDPEPTAPAAATLEDQKALLLIRAMIAAANADGEISPDERQRIASKLDQAGAGAEERAVLEQELANPRSVDQIVREVRDQETAEQVYLASRIAMEPDTPAEHAYLDYLVARLNLPKERTDQLAGVA